MEKGNTKQEILKEALNLFSVQGFEATSISQIADAVGIRKASLYSHFENKQSILDALIEDVLKRYEMHSIFAKADWNPQKDGQHITSEDAAKMIQGQIQYILHDPYISKARKMLVIEQYRNVKMAQLQSKQSYNDVMQYFTRMIQNLIRQEVLIDADAEVMAAQFCLPISIWISLCDREPEREEMVMELAERHIRQFFRIYEKRK